MGTTWFTADLHLGHERVISYSERPFKNIGDHDRTLMSNWNDRVRDDTDIVWVLGDYTIDGSMYHGLKLLSQLRGRKRLIMGNHDRCWVGHRDGLRHIDAYTEAGFQVVLPWARTRIGRTDVKLSHFPYVGDHARESRFDEYRLRMSRIPILHGHTHSREKVTHAPYLRDWVKQIHVGVDAWDYRPVASHELGVLINEAVPDAAVP